MNSIKKDNLKSEMSFSNWTEECASDFQTFFRYYGIFPCSVDNGPKKILCNYEDVNYIIAHDVILYALVQKIRSKKTQIQYLKRIYGSKNLVSPIFYLALSPNNNDANKHDWPAHYILDNICKGFLTLHSVFRTERELIYPRLEGGLEYLPTFLEGEVLLDGRSERIVCMLKILPANKYIGNPSRKITVDNCPQFKNIGLQNFVGFINFFIYTCKSHAYYNLDGALLNYTNEELIFYTVYPGISKSSFTCPHCSFQKDGQEMNVDNLREFFRKTLPISTPEDDDDEM
jgi:hypothetical protein